MELYFLTSGCSGVYRYVAILHPFAYERAITKKRVYLMIAGSWILSALLSYVPIFAGWYTTRQHLRERHGDPTLCTFEVSRPYAFISSSISFWIPCLVMVIFYQRILTTALRQEREIRKLMIPIPAEIPEAEEPDDQCYEEQTKVLIDRANTNNNNSSGGQHQRQDRVNWEELTKDKTGEKDSPRNHVTMACNREGGMERSKKTDIRQVKKIRKEHRAAKTLGIIMGSFILCMGPIFLWYTITFGICPDTCQLTDSSNMWVITLVFWIGYFNSCMNPFIYAFFNRDFHQAFKKLLQSVRWRGDTLRRSSTSSEIPPTPTPPTPLLPSSTPADKGISEYDELRPSNHRTRGTSTSSVTNTSSV